MQCQCLLFLINIISNGNIVSYLPKRQSSFQTSRPYLCSIRFEVRTVIVRSFTLGHQGTTLPPGRFGQKGEITTFLCISLSEYLDSPVSYVLMYKLSSASEAQDEQRQQLQQLQLGQQQGSSRWQQGQHGQQQGSSSQNRCKLQQQQ